MTAYFRKDYNFGNPMGPLYFFPWVTQNELTIQGLAIYSLQPLQVTNKSFS